MKNSVRKGNQTSIEQELKDLARIIAGSEDLDLRKKKLEEIKKNALKKQKNMIRQKIATGELVLDTGDSKRVVQKLKQFSWDAPIRKRYLFDTKTLLILALISSLFIVYLVILGNYGLIAVVISILFLIYVGGVFEPVTVTHSITTRGIETLGKHYEWDILTDFYFTVRGNEYFLFIDTLLNIPSRLILLIDKKDIVPVFILLQDKVLYKDMKNVSRIDKISFGEYIPIEDI